jgi:hypothetical protein
MCRYSKIQNNPQISNTSDPSISDKGYSTCCRKSQLFNSTTEMTFDLTLFVVETAENIGFACELLTEDTTICYGEDIK